MSTQHTAHKAWAHKLATRLPCPACLQYNKVRLGWETQLQLPRSWGFTARHAHMSKVNCLGPPPFLGRAAGLKAGAGLGQAAGVAWGWAGSSWAWSAWGWGLGRLGCWGPPMPGTHTCHAYAKKQQHRQWHTWAYSMQQPCHHASSPSSFLLHNKTKSHASPSL